MEERENGRGNCLECLQRQIDYDFQLQQQQQNQALPLFCHALSAFSALVQIPPNQSQTGTQPSDGSASSTRFILTQLMPTPLAAPTCFTSYLDECIAAPDLLNGSADALAPSASQSSSCTCTCNCTGLFSCPSRKIVNALAPLAHVATCSRSILQHVAAHFLSGALEQHVLRSLSLFIQAKSSPLDSLNFLRLLGLPDFPDCCIPSCLRHPNLVPVLSLLKSSHFVYSVLPATPYTLETILHYSPNAFKAEWHLKFLLYQLLSALAYLHGLGVSHGNICPSNVMLTDSLWLWLRIFDKPISVSSLSSDSTSSTVYTQACCCMDDCTSGGLYADLKLSFCVDWPSQFHRWWKGELSNFEYLLVLNRLAGRRWGDHAFHTVMPWVIDFSIKPDDSSILGWRDLSKSKWRLAKGDEQLDFTYSTSELPHHVSDECLSDLAVCSYKARRLPLSVLRLAVRSVYEPNEYPSTMQRLYQWTPDECIPEFYCDPRIFYSIHSGMADLAVPSWASSPEDFIKVHRDALESDRVSRQIHHWIDITFGYKMSGEAAIAAKNVMLPSIELTNPRSFGRRQLFSKPHPARQLSTGKICDTSSSPAWSSCPPNGAEGPITLLSETAYLQAFEEASAFAEHAAHLSPRYCCDLSHCENGVSCVEELASKGFGTSTSKAFEILLNGIPSDVSVSYVLEHMESDLDSSIGYQELLLWKQKSYCSKNLSVDFAKDIFSVGCIMAELFLKRPLFNSTSLTPYTKSGIVPGLIEELPPHIKGIVEACIDHDWTRRPTAKSILDSPYFDSTVKASYLFVAPLHLLGQDGTCLEYAANFARQGALKAMGSFAAEMCAPYCLHLLLNPQSDIEAEWASILLREFVKCLTAKAVKTLVLPAIQKILQTTGYSHLKVLLLQGSFVQELWNLIGKQAYLETIHPLVISNLSVSPHKTSAAVASVLLICTSEELGVPITVNQTILPLIYCFGKGLCSDGIDVLVRIGGLFGETFIVSQMLPLLKQVIHSCVNTSLMNKPEPVQSWCALALIDCLTTLDGLVALLPEEVVVKELIEDRNCIHVLVIMQANLGVSVLQIAASTLVGICHRIGPDLTASHVLPQLKELFDELAFSQEIANGSGSFGKSLKTSKTILDGEAQIESRTDLVLLLYPSFASLLGIEKLRQCCATWLLLEQFLLKYHNWKWEYTGELSRSGLEGTAARRSSFKKASTSEYNPAKLLLNGVGWSIPQSQGSRGAKILSPRRQFDATHQSLVEGRLATSSLSNREPWFWFPTPADGWDGLDFLGRVGTLKDELPWKIRASIIYSIHAHQGALRSLAVSQDECSIYTAGMGPGFKGGVQRWELSRINCISGYYGHEEVVNDICILSSNGRIASCDGTIHVWNSRTGKALSVFSEPSIDSAHLGSPLSSTSKISLDHLNSPNSNTLSNALLTTTFDGSLYTCIHRFGSPEMLIAGTGNGSIRFIDVTRGQKLHLWRGESVESSFPSLVSAICSCESEKLTADGSSTSPTWIAVGLSSGHCRLFDSRNGGLIASWRAHDGYVTKLAAPEGHLLASSSFDRTLRIWDLRRNLPMQATVVKGHSDSVSGFALWGQDVISISRNKIGISALSKHAQEDGQQKIIPQKLFFADNGTKSLSVLTSIRILPFSRVFVVGTEDGYLRICC